MLPSETILTFRKIKLHVIFVRRNIYNIYLVGPSKKRKGMRSERREEKEGYAQRTKGRKGRVCAANEGKKRKGMLSERREEKEGYAQRTKGRKGRVCAANEGKKRKGMRSERREEKEGGEGETIGFPSKIELKL
jgi:hypothetical protein